MKVSEKIIELRKAYGMTQEELAHICNVSRQSYVCEECRKQGIEEAHMNWPE